MRKRRLVSWFDSHFFFSAPEQKVDASFSGEYKVGMACLCRSKVASCFRRSGEYEEYLFLFKVMTSRMRGSGKVLRRVFRDEQVIS